MSAYVIKQYDTERDRLLDKFSTGLEYKYLRRFIDTRRNEHRSAYKRKTKGERETRVTISTRGVGERGEYLQ